MEEVFGTHRPGSATDETAPLTTVRRRAAASGFVSSGRRSEIVLISLINSHVNGQAHMSGNAPHGPRSWQSSGGKTVSKSQPIRFGRALCGGAI
jgi:hypothetical protein